VLLLSVALAGALGWLVVTNPFNRADVPDVVGAKESAAVSTLTAAGFTVAVTDRQFSEKVPVGEVISTDPQTGAGARKGSQVALIVSLGPERYEVPRVRGSSPEEATGTLAATNLRVAGQRREYHDSVDSGTVIATAPPRGTEVKRDTGVTLIVSKGPAPVTVPTVSGMDQSSATMQLEGLGLQVRTSTQQSTSVAEGLAIGTDPAAGATLHRGDRIGLIVSEGPPPVPVPNVVDMPRDQATAALKAAGFQVKVSEGVVTPLGRVFESNPAPGQLAPVGSTVTISVF
jgi:serine/threonine-protein kinase